MYSNLTYCASCCSSTHDIVEAPVTSRPNLNRGTRWSDCHKAKEALFKTA